MAIRTKPCSELTRRSPWPESWLHPLSLAYALDWAAMLYRFRGEGEAAQEQAAEGITLSTEGEFSVYLAWGRILHGWALAEQGQEAEGIAQVREGLDVYRATGAQAVLPYHLALLAEMYGKRGQAEEGLAMLAEALTLVHNKGEWNYEAELYRLKGDLLLQQRVPDTPQSEVCFHLPQSPSFSPLNCTFFKIQTVQCRVDSELPGA